jgi:hypothetical protein
MNFNEDDTNFNDPNYSYEEDFQDLPIGCPFRQRPPFPGSPQGPQGRPPSAPPGFIPNQLQAQHFGAAPFVDAGAIRFCRFRFSYIWPRRGQGFWAWITFVGPRSMAGFRWERNRWIYFGMDLRSIDSFQCF